MQGTRRASGPLNINRLFLDAGDAEGQRGHQSELNINRLLLDVTDAEGQGPQ